VTDILKAISDDKSLLLFNTIAITNGETEIQVRELGLTLKQYYSRMAKLTKADLVRRKNGKYFLTLMGRIVYDSQMIIGKALNYYWKLHALDSIQSSSSAAVPREELTKLIDTLIENHEIKDILMKTPLPHVDYHLVELTPQVEARTKKEKVGLAY